MIGILECWNDGKSGGCMAASTPLFQYQYFQIPLVLIRAQGDKSTGDRRFLQLALYPVRLHRPNLELLNIPLFQNTGPYCFYRNRQIKNRIVIYRPPLRMGGEGPKLASLTCRALIGQRGCRRFESDWSLDPIRGRHRACRVGRKGPDHFAVRWRSGCGHPRCPRGSAPAARSVE
jgi:hypothetical protein